MATLENKDICAHCRQEFDFNGKEFCKPSCETLHSRNHNTNLFYEDANIPLKFHYSTYENFKVSNDRMRDEIKKVHNFKKKRSLLITGPAGTGKTHLSIGILKRIGLKYPVSVYALNTTSFILQIRDCFSNNTSEFRIVNKYVNKDVLLIDDIGKERLTENSSQALYALINERYEKEKATIITTNLSTIEIARRYTPAMCSRMCSGEVIITTGKDYRIQ